MRTLLLGSMALGMLAAQDLPPRARMPQVEIESYRSALQSYDALFRALKGVRLPVVKPPAAQPKQLFKMEDKACSIPLISMLIPSIPIRTVPPRDPQDGMPSYVPAPPCPAKR